MKHLDENLSQSPGLHLPWLKERLERELWREGEVPGSIVGVDIRHVWDSSRRMTVSYELELASASGGQNMRQTYVGSIVAPEKFAAEYEALGKRAQIQPPLGRAIIPLGEASLVLLAYPNDREMDLLSESGLCDSLGAHLPAILKASGISGDWQVQKATLEPLRYVPGKRLTARCRVTISAVSRAGQQPNSRSRELVFIAKQLNHPRKARLLFENLHLLPEIWMESYRKKVANRSAAAKWNLPVRIPRALALDQQRAVVYLEYLAGKDLKSLLGEIDLERVIPAAGKLLANFHCPYRPGRGFFGKGEDKIVSCESELQEIRQAASAIMNRMPDLKPMLEKLLKELAALPVDEASRISLLHGTFRLNHIFLHQGSLFLLDFDSCCVGHPGYDVANFLASMYYLDAQEFVDAGMRQEVARLFLEGYAAHARSPIPARVVMGFLSGLLIHKQAFKYVKHFHPDRAEKVGQMLALAEVVIERAKEVPAHCTCAEIWKALP